jgi:hypothetical protein
MPAAPPSPPAPAAAPSYAPAPAPAGPPAARAATSKRAASVDQAPTEALSKDALTGGADEKADASADKKSGASLDESVRKADRLFAAQSWSAAADAYRELLRRFPTHKDGTKWRDRINQAVLAEQAHDKASETKAKAAAKAKAAHE